MAKFCSKCGSRLDELTKLCPNCAAEQLVAIRSEKTADAGKVQESHPDASSLTEQNSQEIIFANPAKKDSMGNAESASNGRHLNKKEAKKQRKKEKKAIKKATKRGKKAGWSTGKKIRHFIFKLFLIILLIGLLVSGILCTFVYFGIIDFPEMSYILSRSGIERKVSIDTDSSSDNYIPEERSIVFDDSSQLYYANDEIILFFSMSATDSEKEQVFDYLNGELVGESPELNMYQLILSEKKSLNELSSIADDILNKFDCVVFATYDTATIDQNEAYSLNDPWNKDVSNEDWNDSDVDGSNWWIEAIDGQGAWNYEDEYSKIKIGICDSSFDTGHEDLKNRVAFPNNVLKSRNVVTSWWYSFDNLKHLSKWSVSEQMNYHGTQVAGIIGAEGGNKKGITGIVQNCDILLAPYYHSDNMEAYLAWDSSTYANLAYLVEAGAKVINFSQGKTNFLEENNEGK